MPKKYKHRKTISIKGKRYNIYADDLITLGQKISDKIKAVEEQSKTVGGDTLVSDWAAACVNAYKRKLSEKTRRHYMNSIKNHILLEIGHMRIEDVRPIHCQNILNNQEGFSKSHINTIYQQLRFLFKHAVGDRLIVMDPTTNLVKPDGTQGHRRALTPAERELFLRIAVTDRRYYIYLLMMLCGCRPSEAYACEGRDLSLTEGYPILHIRGTKTGNADRFVPVPNELYELIKNTPPFETIACYNNGNAIKAQNARRVWHSFSRQINIAMGCKLYRNALIPPYPMAPDLTPYCLRHEYCTDLARKGIDIRIAQKLMGHSDIKLTANIYTNLEHRDVLDAAKLLCATQCATKAETR